MDEAAMPASRSRLTTPQPFITNGTGGTLKFIPSGNGGATIQEDVPITLFPSNEKPKG
jgi:hypothetical protein